ncbi:MAG: site-specific integrase [Bacteroidales bacterium]|jgi:integrase|nr:site-specific integrase [Bacteroidales bacterium]
MRKKRTQTVKVTLRFRMLGEGKETLYLDYYPPIIDSETQKPSRREYLGMYVYPLKKRNGEFQKNTDGLHKYSPVDCETIRLAEIIRNNRQNELNKPNIYTEAEAELLKAKERSKGDFIQYFRQLADEKKEANRDVWLSASKYLMSYTQKTNNANTIRFCDIDLQWCEGFKRYLLTCEARGHKTLATNTAASYFVKFKIALKSAYRHGYFSKNLNEDLKGIGGVETHKEILTLDELNVLADTPCSNELVKRAALFSALTGLRHSDIAKMKWSEIQVADGQFTLKYCVQKTGSYQYLPISGQSVQLCGERREPETLVFEGLQYSEYAKVLPQWMGAAGITRHITFHCFRHTYATLQLASGTQPTTIQKMLAHKELQTTLVYAKTQDEAMREATGKIKLNFNIV